MTLVTFFDFLKKSNLQAATQKAFFYAQLASSSSSSYICHGVGPLVDPFRSHVSRSIFKGLPRFLLPVGE